VFDVPPGQPLDPQREVLRRFHAAGGRVVDTSPMYGDAERVLGELAAELGITDELFFATKVWARGEHEGREQIERSQQRLGTAVVDLEQVHNLVDLRQQLDLLREYRAEGHARYIGVTHYLSSRHPELAELLGHASVDFVGTNYSLLEPAAEDRLLPAAIDHGVAVFINQPFETGSLFGWVREARLPEWAREWGIDSWAQYLLKFILGHPAVTCVLPATRDPAHLADNMLAAAGPFPDADTRQRMQEHFRTL
jgi:aryl-alcohol dehydrogenase-like predicted oxidoreductase